MTMVHGGIATLKLQASTQIDDSNEYNAKKGMFPRGERFSLWGCQEVPDISGIFIAWSLTSFISIPRSLCSSFNSCRRKPGYFTEFCPCQYVSIPCLHFPFRSDQFNASANVIFHSYCLKVYMILFSLLHRTSSPVQQVPNPRVTKVSQAKKGYPSPGRQ